MQLQYNTSLSPGQARLVNILANGPFDGRVIGYNAPVIRRRAIEARCKRDEKLTQDDRDAMIAVEAYNASNVVSIKRPTKPASKFGARLPTEDEDAPPLEYIDDDKILPRVPEEGCVLLVVGERSTHKTGFLIKKCLDAIERNGDRILYIATEGGNGVGQARVPAARRARGMSRETINASWRTEKTGFTLVDQSDRDAMLEAHREFAPTIVVIDVMAYTTGGLDIYHPKDATIIMSAAFDLARRFNGATVILANHPKRASSTGESIGSVMFGNLAFGELQLSTEGAGVIKVWVSKMKDGPAHFLVRYQVIKDEAGVPVITSMSADAAAFAKAEACAPLVDTTAEAIKELLDAGGGPYDMAGMVDALRKVGKLPEGIRHPSKRIIALVAEGQLTGYATKAGEGRLTRYTFEGLNGGKPADETA